MEIKIKNKGVNIKHSINVERTSFLLKDSFVYGGASAISKCVALITFPLLTRRFSVVDYGVLDFFMLLAGLIAILVIFGQDSAVAGLFYDDDKNETRCEIVSLSLVIQLGVATVVVPFLWFNANQVSTCLFDFNNSVSLLKTVLLQVPFVVLINFSQNLLKWSFARNQYLIMSIGFTVVQSVAVIVGVTFFEISVHGVLIVSLLSSFLFAVFGIYLVRQWLVRPSDFRHLKSLLAFGTPYGVICVVGTITPIFERAFTLKILGGTDLGVYAVAVKLSLFMPLFVSAFQTAWGPFSMALSKQRDALVTYNWIFKSFTLVVCVLALFISSVSHFAIQFVSAEKYANAAGLVFPLVMGIGVQGIGWITEIGVMISKKSYLSIYGYFVQILISILSIRILVPEFGLIGVSTGVMLSHAGKALISSWLANRAHFLAWNYAPVILMLSLTSVIGIFATWYGQHLERFYTGVILGCESIFVGIFGLFWLYNREERDQMVGIIWDQFGRKINK